MAETKIRHYAKRGDAIPVPDLTVVQSDAYERFLQMEHGPDERDTRVGLESLLREIFPIESYDGTMHLEYMYYALEEPRYTPDECRELKLTYGRPFRVALRLNRQNHPDIPEEEIHRERRALIRRHLAWLTSHRYKLRQRMPWVNSRIASPPRGASSVHPASPLRTSSVSNSWKDLRMGISLLGQIGGYGRYTASNTAMLSPPLSSSSSS